MNAMLSSFLKRRFQPSVPAAAILALQIWISSAVSADAGQYRVIEVLTGDTLRVEDSRAVLSVRLVGIDAPENRDDTSPGQPFSEESRRYLSQLVFQKDVDVLSFGYDIENNVLGAVLIDGKDIGVEIVKAGLAEVDSVKTPPGFDSTSLREAEKQAHSQGRGIWSLGAEYVSPRNWRKQRGPSPPLAGLQEPGGIVEPQAAEEKSDEPALDPSSGPDKSADPGQPASGDAATGAGGDRKTVVVHGIDFEIGDSSERLRVSIDGFSVPKTFDIDGEKPRIVIDIFNVSEWKGRTRIPVNGKLIRQVRTYLHKDSGKLRIVMDLNLDPTRDYPVDQYYDVNKGTYWIEIRK
ncbi:MAG: AMIN domain-containing protein [Desulfobacteraceae bacterium]|nr:MAG: AMIN domain-containing protein [Desulfobacteraceae bacterium]